MRCTLPTGRRPTSFRLPDLARFLSAAVAPAVSQGDEAVHAYLRHRFLQKRRRLHHPPEMPLMTLPEPPQFAQT